MPYSYDLAGGGSGRGVLHETLQIANDGRGPRFYAPRGIITSEPAYGINGFFPVPNYFGRYTIGAYPIAFSRDMLVTGVGLNVNKTTDFGTTDFPGGLFRVWVYESGPDGFPKTNVISGALVEFPLYNVDDATVDSFGGYAIVSNFYNDVTFTAKANTKYWVVSQALVTDTDYVVQDINAELFTGPRLTTLIPTGSEPLGSQGVEEFDIGYSQNGIAGLFIDEIQAAGYAPISETNIVPDVLSGTFEDGLYPTVSVFCPRLRAEIA